MKNIIIKSLMFLVLLNVMPLAYSYDCKYIDESSSIKTELEEECKQQFFGDSNLIENIKSLSSGGKTEVADALQGKSSVISDFDISTSYMIYAVFIVFIAALVVAISSALFVIGKALFSSMFDVGNTVTVGGMALKLKNLAIKALLVKFRLLIVMTAFLVGMGLLALAVYNFQVADFHLNNLNPETFKEDKEFKANNKIDNEMNGYLKYYSCMIDIDKRIINTYMDDERKIDGSEPYLACMRERNFAFESSKNNFTPTYLQAIKHCSFQHASVSTAKCGDFNFKNDSQQIYKEKLIQSENKFLDIIASVTEFYCANQVLVRDQHDFQRYCISYNPKNSDIKLDERGRAVSISSSKSYSEIESSVNDLKAELSLSLQAVASNHFSNYKPAPVEYSFVQSLMDVINGSETVRAAKAYNTEAMDYDFKYTPEFRFSQIQAVFSSINNVISGGTKTVSSHNDRISEILDELTAKSESEQLKELIYYSANFLGADYFKNLGVDQPKGGDYNVISNTITSGFETSKFLLTTAYSLKIAKGVVSLGGSKNFSGKPNLTMVALENQLDFFEGVFKFYGFLIAGSIFGLLIIIISNIVSQILDYLLNVFKIGVLADMSNLINSIEDKKANGLNFDDVKKFCLHLLYVSLSPVIKLFAFRLAIFITYFATYIMKQIFFFMNDTLGFINPSSFTMFNLISFLTTLFMFYLLVVITQRAAMKYVHDSFDAVLLKKWFGSQENQNAAFLADAKELAAQTQGHFGQHGKSARSQRI